MSRSLNKTCSVSFTLRAKTQRSATSLPNFPYPIPPFQPTVIFPVSGKRWQQRAIFWKCTGVSYEMKKPAANCNASISDSPASPFNSTNSSSPRNEERLAGQIDGICAIQALSTC